MLRMIGCDAAVLVGGLAAWTGPIETGPGRAPSSVEFTAVEWPDDRLANADDVVKILAEGGSAIDARSRERFVGEVVQIDKQPGHIPGARSAPWSEVLGADTLPKDPPISATTIGTSASTASTTSSHIADQV